MFCQKCGTQMPDNATFCPSCGTAAAGAAAGSAGPNPASVAADKVKTASKDALQAFKIFATNPVGGLAPAHETLGPRAMGVGITFGAIVSFCILFAIYRMLGEWGAPRGFGGFLKTLLVSIVPFVTLTVAGLAIRMAFRGAGGLGSDCFISGASLLPVGILSLVALLLGPRNMDTVWLFFIFALCLTVLMLFAGLTRICKLSERSATVAVPLMLIASIWLSHVIYKAMLTHFNSY